MTTFEVTEYTMGDETFKSIKMTDENGLVWAVPNDPNNSDYQAYLVSLEEQA